MDTLQSQRFVSQESEGIGCQVSPRVVYFLRELANLECLLTPTGDEVALTVVIGYHARISLHGTPADLRRLSELIRTTLDEWEARMVVSIGSANGGKEE